MTNEFTLKSLSEMSLPESILNQVNLIIQSSKKTGELPGHIMLDGIAGGGKTTLAGLIAKELNMEFIQCGITTNYAELFVELNNKNKKNAKINRMYFMDEAHAIPKSIFDLLLTVLSDNEVTMSRNGLNYIFHLPQTTWTISTTNPEKIPLPFKNRCSNHITFAPYDSNTLKEIAIKNLTKLNLILDEDSLNMLVRISRKTPRTLIHTIIKNLDRYTSLIDTRNITYPVFLDYMKYIGIDQYGLSERERAVIRLLGEDQKLTAMPVKTISTMSGIDEVTLKESVEPYLVSIGAIGITTRGRMLTQHGLELYKELET